MAGKSGAGGAKSSSSRLPSGMAAQKAPAKAPVAAASKKAKAAKGGAASKSFSMRALSPPAKSHADSGVIQLRSSSASPPARGDLMPMADVPDRVPSRSLEPHRRVALPLRKKASAGAPDRSLAPTRGKPGTPASSRRVSKMPGAPAPAAVVNHRAAPADRPVTPARRQNAAKATPKVKRRKSADGDEAPPSSSAGTAPATPAEAEAAPAGGGIECSAPVTVGGDAGGRPRDAFDRPSPPRERFTESLRFTAGQSTAAVEADGTEVFEAEETVVSEAAAASAAGDALQPMAAFARSPSPHSGPETGRQGKPAKRNVKPAKKKAAKKKEPAEKEPLLPLQREEWGGVVTVVLDMDETLLWHPSLGNVYLRPGARDLLKGLKGRCEVVLWTASTKAATDIALSAVNIQQSDFTHIITRDRRWFNWRRATKDIRLLGRDLNRVVVVENSPFCLKLNSKHGLLVTDYRLEKSNRMAAARDDTLYKVDRVLQRLIAANVPVPDFLKDCEECELKHFRLTASPTLSSFYCVV